MFYVFNSANGFDRATASKHETLEEAGWEILGYDQSSAGVDYVGNIWLPWQQPHRGPRKFLYPFAGVSRSDALERIGQAECFGLECFTEEQAARCEADAQV